MKDLKDTSKIAKQLAEKSILIITTYRLAVLALIIGSAVSFALFRTRSYIDIPRDEAVYSEGITQINYKSIDTESLAAFKEQQADQDIQVNSQFDPNRQNPFTE